jgi:hypothetical protein
LNTKETRGWRPLVFLAVLLSHLLVVLVVIRTSRQGLSPSESADEPLVVMVLHDKVPLVAGGMKPRAPTLHARTATPEPVPGNSITTPPVPPPPKIDWEQEVQLAAQKSIADADKEKSYRDLSALSAAQLDWAKRNHLEPAPPGIQWNHPRVEVQSGLPVIWINDRCVMIPVMMLAVFCSIGHIEPRGDLFKHMRDPHDP